MERSSTTCSCKKPVGFPATKDLCSMCFNDDDYNLINERTRLPKITLKTSNNSNPSNLFDHLVRRFVLTDDDEDNDDLKSKSCECFCDNEVGRFGSRCRCGGRFCVEHLSPEEHGCKYECKTAGDDEGSTEFLKENINPLPVNLRYW